MKVKCNCGNYVEFSDDEIIKFCSKCGNKINKMLHGKSWEQAAAVRGQVATELLLEEDATEFFFIGKNYTVGKGTAKISAVRLKISSVFGSVGGGAVIVVTEDVHAASMFYSRDGYMSLSIDKKLNNKRSTDVSDDEIFSRKKNVISENVLREMSPVFLDKATKEEYEEVVKLLESSSVEDMEELLIDGRCKKPVKRSTDKLPGVVEEYYAVIEKKFQDADAFNRMCYCSLTPRRTIARALKKGDSLPILTIFGEKMRDPAIIITTDDIMNGTAKAPDKFQFVSDGSAIKLVWG